MIEKLEKNEKVIRWWLNFPGHNRQVIMEKALCYESCKEAR